MSTYTIPTGGADLRLRQQDPLALATGMINATLLAIPLWLLILRVLGII
jgi:hypothetical protein